MAVAIELSGGKDRAKAEKWFKEGILASKTASEANWVRYLQFLIEEDRASEAKALMDKAPPEFKNSRDMKLLKAVAHRYLNEDGEAEKILSDCIAPTR